MRFVQIISLWAGFVTASLADEGDDTLKFYLSKSEMVVQGKILTKPDWLKDEAGVITHHCKFRIVRVLKGDAQLKGKTIAARIVRFEAHASDSNPLIAKNSNCILFLESTQGTLVFKTVDFWFGIQPPSSSMASSLKRLVSRKPIRKKSPSAAEEQGNEDRTNSVDCRHM